MRRAMLALVLALAATGCTSGNYVRAPQAASVPPAATGTTFRTPEVMSARGTDGVIGSDASALTRRFGTPRIDLTEGDARKLQFASVSCVLDIFLYPLEAGRAPVATHIAARARQGGAAADSAYCINEVERAAD